MVSEAGRDRLYRRKALITKEERLTETGVFSEVLYKFLTLFLLIPAASAGTPGGDGEV